MFCSIVRLGFDPSVMLGIRVATQGFEIDSVCDSLIWQRILLTYVQRLLSHLADDSNIENEVFFSESIRRELMAEHICKDYTQG